MLTVVHVPYTYYPDAVGGTEIYVEQLARGLRQRGVKNLIAAPGTVAVDYEYDGIPVHRLAVDDTIRDLNLLYGEGDAGAAEAFGAWLDTVHPDVVHLHAFTRIVSVQMVRAIQKRGIPTVFTYHTPTVSCMRSGLMLWGKEPCDGVLETGRCTCCRLHSLGLPRPLATVMAHVPDIRWVAGSGRSGPVWTVLQMRNLIARQHAAIRELLARVDCVVALSEWTHRVLRANEVPADKIVVIPHGLEVCPASDGASLPVRSDRVLRVVALGRLEPIKGMDLIVHALEQLPDAPITLDIYGIQQSKTESAYARRLREQVLRDARIRLLPPVGNAQIVALLKNYDVLAVPSQWFETGPLVVLEAFAAGIPVIGSNLGGIAEKVQDGVTGLLVQSFDARGWRNALERLASDPALPALLRANVQRPRSVEQVVVEMLDVYARVLARHQNAPAAART